jgi:membrane fusion protein, multidrug efflux system
MLWPGELVNARLLLKTLPNGVTIPPSAIQQGPHGSYVYVVTPSGTAELRTVKVAQITKRRALIDSGVQANETVVVEGQYRLQPGSRVNILTGKAATEADLQSSVEQAIP